MFNQTRYGRYNSKIYNNDTPSTLKILGFLFVAGIAGAIGYALITTSDRVTEGIGQTWTTQNNDTLIRTFVPYVGWALIMLSAVFGLVAVGFAIPWFIRNMRIALAPIPGARQSYNVIEPDDPELIEAGAQPGLLIEGNRDDYYIDATRQIEQKSFARGFSEQE